MRFYQLDNDTKKYIKRLNYNGAKTPSDIYSVDQFIRGLKDLGVYGNLIEAWFFRKNQNIGNGNTVFAFKDSFNNGTINNISTASWDDRGLVCIANATSSLSNYINGNLRPNTLPTVSMFSIFMSTPAGMENFTSGYPCVGYLGIDSYYSVNKGSSLVSAVGLGNSGTSWSASFNGAINTSSINGNTLFKIIKASISSSSVLVESRNSSSALTSSSASNTEGSLRYDRFLFGGRWNDFGFGSSSAIIESSNGAFAVGFHGTQIFHCFFDINVDFTSFESLFKSTIGRGIDLP